MLTKQQYMEEYNIFEVEKASYFIAFIGDYLNENLKQLGDIEERKNWVGLNQDIFVNDSVSWFEVSTNHIYCDVDLFSNMEGYVSHQIPLIREKLCMLQQVLTKLKLNRCIKLSVGFDNTIKKTLQKNDDYDPITYPYKYFSNKEPVAKIDMNLNLLPESLKGYLNICQVEIPTKEYEIYE